MRRVITSINMTLDGYCNHEAGIADAALHESVNRLLRNTGIMVMGRITYQLMEDAWPAIVAKPTGEEAVDDFALLIDDIEKIVFSKTLNNVTWKHTTLMHQNLETTIKDLKQKEGKDILVGGPSLIRQLTNAGLIDEYQLYIQPIILGKGLTLFKDIEQRVDLKLTHSNVLESGVVVLTYEPTQR